MNTTPAHICAFLSKGQNFVDVLRGIRSAYPGASIDAVIPRAYPLSDEERALADRIVETGQAHYGLRDAGPLLRLIRELRASHYDLFVIMFDSPKLRILARLSNARACALKWGQSPIISHPDASLQVPRDKIIGDCPHLSNLIPIHPSIPGVLADVIFRNVWGRVAYSALWIVVRLFPVNKARSGKNVGE